MRQNLLTTLLFLLSFSIAGFAQGNRQDCLDQAGSTGTPQVRTYYSSQDCAGAIALCALNNRYATGYICGNGRVSTEVPTGSCLLQNENNTTWYTFKVRRAGKLKFFIIPLDQDTVNIGATNQGNTDYDWALYKLPPGAETSVATCAQLSQNRSWEVSCNYSGARGTTGMTDTATTAPGAGKFQASINVNVDETYVLVVDNFTGGNLIGYQIRFFDPTTYPTLADIRRPGRPARFDSIIQPPNCLNSTLTLRFSNQVQCRDLKEGVITVVNLADPSRNYSIDTIYPFNCAGNYTNLVKFRFSPLQPDTNYAIILTDTLRDICGNITTHDTLRFKVRPFIRLEGFVDDIRQDTVCSGKTIEVRATPDESLLARLQDFRYRFFYYDSARRSSTPVVFNDSTIKLSADSNSVFFRLNFPVRTRIFLIVSSKFIDILPLPVAPIAAQYATCFGPDNQITIQAGNSQDSSYYNYEWRSRISTRRFPQRQQFNLQSDTVNAADVNSPLVRRSQNDDLTLTVTYKPKYGGCQALPLKTKLLVGARLRPLFFIDTLNRPGKTQIYVADTAKFVDLSTFFSGNNKRLFQESWAFGDNNVYVRRGPTTDTVRHYYMTEGSVEATLTLSDTVSVDPLFVCSAQYSKRFEIIFPQIPNIITPDADGKNDYFDFVRRMPGYEIKVYNRWGREAYKTNSYSNDFSAPSLDNGFYFYSLKPTKTSGREYKGWLHVVKK